ncbi:hypothetical protein D3C71_1466760 [compost metagenome]
MLFADFFAAALVAVFVAVFVAVRFFAAAGCCLAVLPPFRLRCSNSVRSITLSAYSGASSCGSTTVSVLPAFTLRATRSITAALNSSLNSSGSHLPDMSSTSILAIFNSLALGAMPLAPTLGRSSPSSDLTSSPQRIRFSTSTSPDGIKAARCCLVWITTLAMPILPVLAKVSRNKAYTFWPLLMGAT